MGQGWPEFFEVKKGYSLSSMSFFFLHFDGYSSKLYKDKFDTFLTANMKFTNSLALVCLWYSWTKNSRRKRGDMVFSCRGRYFLPSWNDILHGVWGTFVDQHRIDNPPSTEKGWVPYIVDIRPAIYTGDRCTWYTGHVAGWWWYTCIYIYCICSHI